jgi:mannosyltransferase OCH1-like enzyme
MDLDVGCLKRMTHALQIPMVLPETLPFGVSNDLMIAVPHHPLMKQVINELKNWNHIYGTKFPTVMLSTGPAFLSYQLGRYRKIKPTNFDVLPIRIMDHEIYAGLTASTEFYHIDGNSWHTWDAKVIVLMYRYLKELIICCTMISIVCCRHGFTCIQTNRVMKV